MNQFVKMTYLKAIGNGLFQLMKRYDTVFIIGEAVHGPRAIYGVLTGIKEHFGSERIITAPIAENATTGVAIGAALEGLRPVQFHARNDFMLLAMDQLINQAAKIHYMSGDKQRVPLTVVSFVARKMGEGAQHSQSLQALFAHIPGLKVVMPASVYDAKGLLISAVEDDDPVIILYHWISIEEKIPAGYYSVPIGLARVCKQGHDITVVASSATVFNCLEAAMALKGRISVEVIDLRTIRPLDRKTILRSVCKTGRLLVVDTGWTGFGVSAEIIATVVESAKICLKTQPWRLGMHETPAPASPDLLKDYYPTTEKIIQTIETMIRR